MSDSLASLRRKMSTVGDLKSVVRTMKALAAANIGQYENAVRALADYYRAVELGLVACVRYGEHPVPEPGYVAGVRTGRAATVTAVIFGSDQGLVGQFNDTVASCAIETLSTLPGTLRVLAVGERVQSYLRASGISPETLFTVPNSIEAVAPLIGQIQLEAESQGIDGVNSPVYVFHNRPLAGSLYEPVSQRLLPLDALWQEKLADKPWPTPILPEIISGTAVVLHALIREYLYISLYRACGESLASENASRLAAMERADKNIDEVRSGLQNDIQRLRQSGIDEELFDVSSGFEALDGPGKP